MTKRKTLILSSLYFLMAACLLTVYIEISSLKGMLTLSGPIRYSGKTAGSLETMIKRENLNEYALYVSRSAVLRSGGREVEITLYEGTALSGMALGCDVILGEAITDEDVRLGRNVILLEENAALPLTPAANPLGMEVSLYGTKYIVKGIYRPKRSPLYRTSKADGATAMIPLKTYDGQARLLTLWARTSPGRAVFSAQTLEACFGEISEKNGDAQGDPLWQPSVDNIDASAASVMFVIQLIFLAQLIVLDVFLINGKRRNNAIIVFRAHLQTRYPLEALKKTYPVVLRDAALLSAFVIINIFLVGKIEPALSFGSVQKPLTIFRIMLTRAGAIAFCMFAPAVYSFQKAIAFFARLCYNLKQ